MAIFNVTDDAGLAAALVSAGANSEADTINLAAGTYTGTYTFSDSFGLTVNGAKAGIAGDAVGRGISGESILSGAITVGSGAAVTLNGLEVTNDAGVTVNSGVYGVVENTLFNGDGVGSSAGLTLDSGCAADVGSNAFAGYARGVFVSDGVVFGSVHDNHFFDGDSVFGGIGIQTESTVVIITGNTFDNGANAGAAVSAIPVGPDVDVSSYVLDDNTISSLPVGEAVTIQYSYTGLADVNITGTAFDDDIIGVPDGQNSNFHGGAGNDDMHGGSGNDTMDGGAGDDTMAGGGGVNTASYLDSTAGVTVSLGIGGPQDTVGAGVDTLSGFVNLIGSSFNDDLNGDGGNNVINGNDGNDKVSGDLGDDTLNGGGGDDIVRGNENNDLLFGNNGNDSMFGGEGNDILDGGDGDDTLDGQGSAINGNDTAGYLTALGGVNVSLRIAGAQDTGSAGFDTLLNIDNIIGSNFGDNLTGNGSTNTLSGGLGDDTLKGARGADSLFGGDGNDTLSGQSGFDTIVGGRGNDDMRGGNGADVFGFNRVFGNDVIHGFNNASDELHFSAPVGAVTVTLVAGVGIVVSDTDGNSVLLLNDFDVAGVTAAISTAAIPAEPADYI